MTLLLLLLFEVVLTVVAVEVGKVKLGSEVEECEVDLEMVGVYIEPELELDETVLKRTVVELGLL